MTSVYLLRLQYVLSVSSTAIVTTIVVAGVTLVWFVITPISGVVITAFVAPIIKAINPVVIATIITLNALGFLLLPVVPTIISTVIPAIFDIP